MNNRILKQPPKFVQIMTSLQMWRILSNWLFSNLASDRSRSLRAGRLWGTEILSITFCSHLPGAWGPCSPDFCLQSPQLAGIREGPSRGHRCRQKLVPGAASISEKKLKCSFGCLDLVNLYHQIYFMSVLFHGSEEGGKSELGMKW